MTAAFLCGTPLFLSEMNFHPDKDIDNLLDLLDDEDESIAVYAMGELLDREDRLGGVLGMLQEHPDGRLRRRVHQLEAAITLRRRRRRFRELLGRPDFDLKQGLVEVHLQWFDNDSRPDLERRWAVFFDAVGGGSPVPDLTTLGARMRRYGMTAAAESVMQPENYCIGTVLDHRQGAASLLCAAGLVLLGRPEVRAVRTLGEFAIRDGGDLLLPLHDWETVRAGSPGGEEFWDRRSLLKFTSFMLFGHAVASDSFRYIQTIGQALAGGPDGELPETLPYPYCPAEDAGGGESADDPA